MHNKLLTYGIFFWLTAFLFFGFVPMSSKVYAQRGYPKKVLETEKKKKPKKKRQLKKSRKPTPSSNGTEVLELSTEPLMDLRKPGENAKPLPKNDKHYQPELNGGKNQNIKRAKVKKPKRIFQGHQKIKKNEIIPPGTPYNERSERMANKKRESQGTNYQGNRKSRRSEITEPGQGLNRTDRAIRNKQEEQGTGYGGSTKVKKGEIHEPGTYHSDRSEKLLRKYRNKGAEGTYAGKQRIRKNQILKPGTPHDERSETLKNKYRNKAVEGSFAGHRKIKKNEITEPGTHYSERKESVALKYSSYKAGNHPGTIKVPKKNLREPGTHHLDRKMSQAEQYESTAAAKHSGSLRVKKQYLKKPGIHYSDRKASMEKQYSSYEATDFEGNIRAMSRKEKARYYEKQSRKVHQFEGTIRIRHSQRDMHPSAAARRSVVMRSREQVERKRNFHLWWNRLWKKEQPEVVMEKPPKSRYDKEESTIWNQSRDW